MVHPNLITNSCLFINYNTYFQDFRPLYFRHKNSNINVFISLTTDFGARLSFGFPMGITSTRKKKATPTTISVKVVTEVHILCTSVTYFRHRSNSESDWLLFSSVFMVQLCLQ